MSEATPEVAGPYVAPQPAEEVLSEPEAAPADELGPDEPVGPPSDGAADVSLGETITVTLPKATAEVLAGKIQFKLAELSDAQAVLRAALGD